MKRALLTLTTLLCSWMLCAQDDVKKGWVVAPLPDFGYNSDNGFNWGAFCDFYYYGDGSTFPNPLHHIAIQADYTTRGAWHVHALLDSRTLIPGVRVTGSLTYRDALLNPFYGYNGIAAPYSDDLAGNEVTQVNYYGNRKISFRAALAMRGELGGKWSWMGGAVYRQIGLQDFISQKYKSGNSLYLDYIQDGLIRADEAAGGGSLELKAGVTYDSRDIEFAPRRGMNAEVYLLGNLDLSHGHYHYGQLVAHFKHFVPLLFGRITFAYHLGLQHQIWGEMPFYNLQELSTLTYLYEEYTGLGSRFSIRGYKLNRILASGYAWSNIELRAKVADFHLFRQRVELVLNPFVDLGMITRTYRLDEQQTTANSLHPDRPYYQADKLPVMVSLGSAFKIHINSTINLSVDVSKAVNDKGQQLGEFMIGTMAVYAF